MGSSPILQGYGDWLYGAPIAPVNERKRGLSARARFCLYFAPDDRRLAVEGTGHWPLALRDSISLYQISRSPEQVHRQVHLPWLRSLGTSTS